jgi:hypothetical protein
MRVGSSETEQTVTSFHLPQRTKLCGVGGAARHPARVHSGGGRARPQDPGGDGSSSMSGRSGRTEPRRRRRRTSSAGADLVRRQHGGRVPAGANLVRRQLGGRGDEGNDQLLPFGAGRRLCYGISRANPGRRRWAADLDMTGNEQLLPFDAG